MITLLPLLCFQSGHPHSSAELVSSLSVAAPGKPFLAAIHMKMDPTWHTYWINPGDSGVPTTVDWTLPPGWKADPILWPTPSKLEMGGLVNYSYEGEVLLLVKLTPPPTAQLGMTAKISGVAKWLICQQGCLPAQESISATVRIGQIAIPDTERAEELQTAENKLPKALPGLRFSAKREGKTIQLTVAGSNIPNVNNLYFFPSSESIEPAAKQTLRLQGKTLVVTLKVSDFAPSKISRLSGLLATTNNEGWGKNTDAIVVDTPVETNGR